MWGAWWAALQHKIATLHCVEWDGIYWSLQTSLGTQTLELVPGQREGVPPVSADLPACAGAPGPRLGLHPASAAPHRNSAKEAVMSQREPWTHPCLVCFLAEQKRSSGPAPRPRVAGQPGFQCSVP